MIIKNDLRKLVVRFSNVGNTLARSTTAKTISIAIKATCKTIRNRANINNKTTIPMFESVLITIKPICAGALVAFIVLLLSFSNSFVIISFLFLTPSSFVADVFK